MPKNAAHLLINEEVHTQSLHTYTASDDQQSDAYAKHKRRHHHRHHHRHRHRHRDDQSCLKNERKSRHESRSTSTPTPLSAHTTTPARTKAPTPTRNSRAERKAERRSKRKAECRPAEEKASSSRVHAKLKLKRRYRNVVRSFDDDESDQEEDADDDAANDACAANYDDETSRAHEKDSLTSPPSSLYPTVLIEKASNNNDVGARDATASTLYFSRILCGTPRLEAQAAAHLAPPSPPPPLAQKRRGRVKGRIYKKSGRRARRYGSVPTNADKKAIECEEETERFKQEQEQRQAEEGEQQQQEQRRLEAEEQLLCTGSTRCAVAAHLDPDAYNLIETLECETKKPGGGKRKRVNNSNNNVLAATPTSRKRLTLNPRTVDSVSGGVATGTISAGATIPCYWSAPRALRLRRTRNNSTSNNNNNNNNSTSVIINNSNNNNINSSSINNKNNSGRNIMSLYDRRYQNEDVSGGGSRGIVTNGYLNIPSTRNNSLTATSASDIGGGGGGGGDSQEAPYMTSGVGGGVNANSAAMMGNGGTPPNHAATMATLCNIGNTCYLNSVVYTLRFAPRFLHNLHHLVGDVSAIQQNMVRQHAIKSSSLGRGISGVQLENARSWSSKDLASLEQSGAVGGGGGGFGGPSAGGTASTSSSSSLQKSSHQFVSERLHELYQNLHRNEANDSTEPFHADTLLQAIQDVSSIFEGNQQQDAHEFLMCMLNSIRETCQSLIKAIAECPDLIVNGCISNQDELDATGHAPDKFGSAAVPSSSSHVSGTSGGSASLSSSLSTSKASFFSRKSKRKEEAKASKSSRLQSPLKEGGGVAVGGSGSGGVFMQPQPPSNSFFYLNTVDLNCSDGDANNGAVAVSANAALALKSAHMAGVDATDGGLLKDNKERLAERIRELGLNFFSEDFEGVTVSTTKCLSCETITEQKETMIDIAVPVPISGVESTDYTEKPGSFIQNSCITREYFRGENKYRCEQCTGYTEAIRSISYEVLPRLLVIQLSRFSGGMEKINSYIPTSFTLQCFCAKCCELGDGNKLHVYKLYSVITHVGATMSVGHYIAYTCSLDSAHEYLNCPKERRSALAPLQQQLQTSSVGLASTSGGSAAAHTNASSASTSSAAASAAASALASGTNLMKKMKFGRSKASSSGDMSKHVKTLNGLTSKSITNGIGKLNMNTTCHSLSCCATRLCSAQQAHQQQQQQQYSNSGSDLSEESLQNGANHSTNSTSNSSASYIGSYPFGYGSTGRGGVYRHASYSANASGEPIWYMCDDDKIKAMSQREFEELLSPSRKITVTPYLLFYARFDLQPPSSAAAASTTTGSALSHGSKQQTSATTPSTSWSTESLQSGALAAASAQHKM